MHREIKFKVWDLSQGKFIKWAYLLPNGEVMNHGTGEIEKNAIVVQYTGYKDKNGKEIYDRDLFQYPKDGKEYFEDEDEPVEMYWEPEKAGWDLRWAICKENVCPNDDFMGCYEYNKEIPTLEIIGNAFENPELLV